MKKINLKIMGALSVFAFLLFAASCGTSSSGVASDWAKEWAGSDQTTKYKELEGYWKSALNNGRFRAFHILADGTYERKQCTQAYGPSTKDYLVISGNRIIADEGPFIITDNDHLTDADGQDSLTRVNGNSWPSCP